MECGECTVCCTLSVVPELNKRVGETCKFCVNNGCDIYGNHPNTCKEFECAYLQGGNIVELRPDRCGIMFAKRSDRIFSGILVPNMEVSDMAKAQIESFKKQGYSVIILNLGDKPYIELAKEHDRNEIYNEYLNILKHGNL